MDLIGGIRNAMNLTNEASKKKPKKNKKKNKVKRKAKEPIVYPTPVKLPKKRPGQLYTFGSNICGQLGISCGVLRTAQPTEVQNFKDNMIKMVACGSKHTLVLDMDGVVWSFGSNDDKALGRPCESVEDERTPTRVKMPQLVKQVSAGDGHSAALTVDGEVYAWGCYKNRDGKKFGIDSYLPEEVDTENTEKPWRITAELKEEADVDDVRIIKIESGANHIVMLGDDSRMYTCGSWDSGQLGRQQADPKRMTRKLEEQRAGFRLTDKEYHFKPGLVFIGNKSEVKNVWAAKNASFCFAGVSGYLYVMGDNSFCQLGVPLIVTKLKDTTFIRLPTKTNSFCTGEFEKIRWRQFAGGRDHTVAVTETGAVYTLGKFADGSLGLPDGTVVQANGAVGTLPLRVPALAHKICIHVAAGDDTTYALALDGALYGWGVNNGCHPGPPKDPTRRIPTACRGIDCGMEISRLAAGGESVALTMHKK